VESFQAVYVRTVEWIKVMKARIVERLKAGKS
jgi:hypothetical protein